MATLIELSRLVEELAFHVNAAKILVPFAEGPASQHYKNACTIYASLGDALGVGQTSGRRLEPQTRPMFDLVGSINTARATYEAAISVRAGIVADGDSEALRADLMARFKEQATAFGFLLTSIDDDAAQAAVEGKAAAE